MAEYSRKVWFKERVKRVEWAGGRRLSGAGWSGHCVVSIVALRLSRTLLAWDQKVSLVHGPLCLWNNRDASFGC